VNTLPRGMMACVLSAVWLTGCATVRRTPGWVSATPRGYTHDYFVGAGEAPSAGEARRQAVRNALVVRAEQGDVRVEFVRTDRCETQEVRSLGPRGRTTGERRCTAVEEILSSGRIDGVRGLSLAEEYTTPEYNRWRSWVLLRIPKTSGARSTPSRVGIITRSLLVPGWGLHAKGEHGKGYAITFGSVGLAAAGAVAQVVRQEQLRDALNTNVQRDRDVFVQRANALRIGQWASWGAAAALLGYNLLDAAAGPVRLYVTSPMPASIGVELRVAAY